MCGRFTQSYTWRELVELYRLTQPALNLQPRYNIAPTTTIDVLRLAETGPELVPMRWCLNPGWCLKLRPKRQRLSEMRQPDQHDLSVLSLEMNVRVLRASSVSLTLRRAVPALRGGL